uniref:6phosphofructo2kinase/fructose2 putative n=1 Tax=Albugo laibachii Nc14 TaxID=890382 RepID=F0WDH3_9STRA|nr:6phosphofructo2kinase/fructose2 putative [Albugo laibachii Nc14]|eukprot:CCA19245.1 6phosphofructo2kinase/fructose2 putative [Albugo laibachii Nc14]
MTIVSNSLSSKHKLSQNQLSLPPSIAYKSRKTILGANEPNENASSLRNLKNCIDSPNSVGSTSSCSNLRFNRTLSERKIFTQTADKLVLVMVGLPARGKSFIAKKLCKFLCWKGLGCRIFNVGQLRRSVCTDNQDHTFFDPHNEKAIQARDNLAQQSLQLAQEWLLGTKGGDVAIFDATNTTKRRRQMLVREFEQFADQNELSVHVVFIESICTNEAVIDANIKEKVLSSPDYAHMNVEDAIQDLKQRMKNYEAAYQAIEEEENLSYIKLFDLQSKVHANNIYGHVAKSILPYMMSFHIEHRPIWLVRAGHCTEVQSDFHSIAKHPCVATRSANLSALGVAFAEKLAEFVQERTQAVMARTATCATCRNRGQEYTEPCLVMTSTLPRAVETAQFLSHERYEQLATLNPLDKGECYGLSMSEMQAQMPEAYEAFLRDPWKTRFPGGESYFDLMIRVEPILIDIEQHTGPVLVVSHISTLQVLYSYFLGIPIEKCADLEIPFHSVLELIPNQHGWSTTVFAL